MPFFKDMLKFQLDPYYFPDSLKPPDNTLDFHEYDDNLSHTLYIWENQNNDLGLNLAPSFDIVKVCFVFHRWTQVYSIHEIHIQVKPADV